MTTAADVRAAAEAELGAGLTVLAAQAPAARLPGAAELLDERVAYAGPGFAQRRAFRILRAKTGWLGLSLPRESDRELVPALVEAEVDTADAEACWSAVADWLALRGAGEGEARAILLGLAAARIPPDAPRRPARPPVLVQPGPPRRHLAESPRVVDLSALWAGPLTARLLGLAGARVLRVESRSRRDAAGPGLERFHDRLHPPSHESLVLDFEKAADLAQLSELVVAADVVIEASRPRALRQRGIRAEEAVDAGAVWCSITAYGRVEPDGMRVGFGDDVAAGAGLVAVASRGAEPFAVGDALADPLTGVAAAAAVVEALAAGRGALLDVSMHDVCRSAADRCDAVAE